MGSAPQFRDFFDPRTFTITYVLWDADSLEAVIIDPVLDYDPASSTYYFDSVEPVAQFIDESQLKVKYILETHAHADHLSGAQEFKRRYSGAQTVIGQKITEVQKVFGEIYNLGPRFARDGSQFDILVDEGSHIVFGSFRMGVIHTPGHTPACYSFYVADMLFTGDALFMPDFGVGRCDFPGGNANSLYDSVINKLYKLPNETRCFTGHDYQPGGREYKCQSTLSEQKKANVHLPEGRSREDFIAFRSQRDAQLKAPRLLLPSIEVNVDGGRLPEPEDNGVSYLKIPIQPQGEDNAH